MLVVVVGRRVQKGREEVGGGEGGDNGVKSKKKSLGNKGFLCVRIFFPFCLFGAFFLAEGEGGVWRKNLIIKTQVQKKKSF